ncbi:MAG: polysaccharide deacetylase family protein [Thermoanaerobacteraceae bacterium]|uniref:polysaccharide deacetylase family protein n=1 Tax=Thermanaeromonas sp. C210 TaxID=2731925 RepID=UPI00155BC3DA|nr:polysaccharide deacetylase family protein [Thermanaeromonas sp. C210]MBE3580867.1 polysaccharide deacetylase family protein [Thermoanaerobacteraceae bacterium]GFN21719.1 deacetylase [Thermanaeromonas sp. C210]
MFILLRRRAFRQVLAGLLLFFAGMLAGGYLADRPPLAVLVGRARRLLPIYSVATTEKKVALSFDATWGAEYTPRILEILRQHNVKTTFFLTNIWLNKYPDVAKKIAAEGHEIGLHSATHPHFTSLSEEEMEQELRENHRMVEEITGYKPELFRPPFGDYNDTVIRVVQRLGYKAIQWDVDSLDWQEHLSADDIYRRVVEGIKPGSIVLFHNNGRYTADVLGPLLEKLKADGYQVVPVSQMLIKGDYYVDHAGVQRPAQ